MQTRNLIALIAGSLLLSGHAFADRPGSDWISIEDALNKARAAGYSEIHKIEADAKGYWEGEGVKKDGRAHEFRIDGKSGEVTHDHHDD